MGFFACTAGGLAYGVLLAWLAAAASGYESDSRSLSLVLTFMAGFPASLLLSAFSAYFIGLAPLLLWAAFGAVVSFSAAAGRAVTVGARLLLTHYIGVLIGLLAVPWAVDSSAHVSAKSVAAVVLGVLSYATGQIVWWRSLPLLDHAGQGSRLPRLALGPPRLARLATGVLVLVASGVVLAEHERLTLTCRRATGECEIERVGWRASKRHVPIEEVTVRFGVPRSRLEIASSTEKETLIGVACGSRTVGGNIFNQCESRGGRLLAAMDAFLTRDRAGEIRIVDDDPWPARAAAALLAALGLWLVTSALLERR